MTYRYIQKDPKDAQFNLFSSPSEQMCEWRGCMYDDKTIWHTKFYKNVVFKEDEGV